MNPIEVFLNHQEEPYHSCFDYCRGLIVSLHPDITESIKYGTLFFLYKKKPLAYLWIDKRSKDFYIAFANGHLVDHPKLQKENTKWVKKYFINPNEDIDHQTVRELIKLYINARDIK